MLRKLKGLKRRTILAEKKLLCSDTDPQDFTPSTIPIRQSNLKTFFFWSCGGKHERLRACTALRSAVVMVSNRHGLWGQQPQCSYSSSTYFSNVEIFKLSISRLWHNTISFCVKGVSPLREGKKKVETMILFCPASHTHTNKATVKIKTPFKFQLWSSDYDLQRISDLDPVRA